MLQITGMAGTSEYEPEYQILRHLVCSRGWYYTNRYVGAGNDYETIHLNLVPASPCVLIINTQ